MTEFQWNPRRRTIAKDYGILSGSADESQSREITIYPRKREKENGRERKTEIQLESPVNTRRATGETSTSTYMEKELRDSSVLLARSFRLYAGIPTTRCSTRSRVRTKSILVETSIKYEGTSRVPLVSSRVHVETGNPPSFRLHPGSFSLQLPQEFPLTRFIFIPDYRPEEDNGNWMCVAGLEGENGRLEEAWDHVRVQQVSRDSVYVSGSSITVLAISITLVLLIVSVVGYICGRYRLRRTLSENPPAYSPQYYPPKSFKFDVKKPQCWWERERIQFINHK